MRALSFNTPLRSENQNVRSSTLTQILLGLCRSFGLVLLALFCSQSLANNPCINLTYPQTVTAETIAGQTRLTLGKPTNAGITNISFTVAGNLVTLNYTYFDACVIVPPAPRPIFFDLGVLLPPGNYQLRAIGNNPPNTPYDVTRPFVVQGVSENVTIPASSTSTMALLAVMVLLVAGASLRRAR